MTVYVGDHVRAGIVNYWPMFSDGGDAELHAFAARIGVPARLHRPKERGAWSHYRISAWQMGAAFRAGAIKADRIKQVEHSCGPRAAKALAKKLAKEGAA